MIMLTDSDRELICAAVDGQLSNEQESGFRTLVAESADALQLFQSLQSHSRRLQAIPQRPAPLSLAPKVMTSVRQLPQVKPSAAYRDEQSKRSVGWIPYVVAASLLLAVTSASFWFAAHRPNDQNAVTHRKQLTRPTDLSHDKSVASSALAPESGNDLLPHPRVIDRNSLLTAVAIPTPNTIEVAPEPRPYTPGDVIGSATFHDQSPLTAVHSRVPFLANVADFDTIEFSARLRDELGRDPAFRLDLFTRDPLRAGDVFQTVIKKAQVTLTIDLLAQERMKKKLPSAWVIYVETLNAEEITKLFGLLAVQTRAEEKNPAFTSGHLYPAFQADPKDLLYPTSQADTKDLRDLLGVDLGPGKRLKAVATKPLAATTVDQVTTALQKNNKPALMLTYLPVAGRNSPNLSAEIQSFLAKRDDRKPGTIPLMIVIRPLN